MKAVEIKIYGLGLILALIFNTECVKILSENDIPELVYLDTSVDPCDDFYKFSCGNFGKIHIRPDNLNLLDQFTILEDELIELGQEILKFPITSDDPTALKKAKVAYKSCTNVMLVSNTVIPQMYTILDVGGMPLISESSNNTQFSWNDIGDLVSEYGVPLIFFYTVSQLSQNETIIRISSDPLANPTLFRPKHRQTYEEILEQDLKEMAHRRKKRSTKPAAFDIFLQTLAKNLLRQTNTSKSDEEIVEELNDMANFMRALYAGGIVDDTPQPLETEITLEQLQIWTENQFGEDININWMEYLSRIFQKAGVTLTPNTKIYQDSVTNIYGVLNLVRQTDPSILKNFALLRVFLYQAPDSDFSTRKAFEDYYNTQGYQLYPREEYCARKFLDVVDTASLSYAVTYAHQQYHYNINKITKASELIHNIRETFTNTVSDSDWMDTESRDSALKKVENMLVLLGYPDFVDNVDDLDAFYENLQICSWDNYGNSRNIRAFRQAYQFSQLGKPDRSFWGKSTFDPNAYYNRPNNKIVIPISMLNPVFFYGNNTVLDYSRLGSIVGHEITHGFDVNGKNYDQDGILISWWTDQTSEAFTEKTQCFKDQYNQFYIPEIDININGTFSINENLADNGGIRGSFKTFKKIITEENITASGKYTLDQLFFIGYATMWCSEESDYALKVLSSSSSAYPPKRFRVIGSLQNMEEFSQAFGCPIGSYMNPENKCLLWA